MEFTYDKYLSPPTPRKTYNSQSDKLYVKFNITLS